MVGITLAVVIMSPAAPTNSSVDPGSDNSHKRRGSEEARSLGLPRSMGSHHAHSSGDIGDKNVGREDSCFHFVDSESQDGAHEMSANKGVGLSFEHCFKH